MQKEALALLANKSIISQVLATSYFPSKTNLEHKQFSSFPFPENLLKAITLYRMCIKQGRNNPPPPHLPFQDRGNICLPKRSSTGHEGTFLSQWFRLCWRRWGWLICALLQKQTPHHFLLKRDQLLLPSPHANLHWLRSLKGLKTLFPFLCFKPDIFLLTGAIPQEKQDKVSQIFMD